MLTPLFLTAMRFMLTPVIMYCIAHSQFFDAALIFACAVMTDFFDGWAARYLKQTTQFGAMFDPLADKGLMIGVLGALWWYAQVIPGWFVAVVCIKELLLIGGSFMLMQKFPEYTIRPLFAAKLLMVVQSLYVVVVFASCMYQFDEWYDACVIEMFAVVCAMWHGYVFMQYAKQMKHMWNHGK